MGKVAVQLMVITIFSKLAGLFREVFFGAIFGTNIAKDIYVIGETVAAIAFSFLFMSMQSCFIPIYTDVHAKYGRKRADRFTSNLTNFLIIISIVIGLLFFIFMKPIISLVAKGYTGEKFLATVHFSRIAIWIIVIRAMVACMISYLNIYNNFIVPAMTGIIFNILIILTAFIASRLNSLTVLAIGTILATGLQYILFPKALKEVGYHHQLVLDVHEPYLKKTFAMGIPVIFSVLVNEICVIIDKTLASSIVVNGGIAAMDYASKFSGFISGIVIISIVTATYPKLSSMISNHEVKAFRKLTAESIVYGLLLVIPSVIGLMLYVKPVIRIFYQHGAFTAQSTEMVAGPLFWYTPGLLGLIFIEVLNRVYYAHNNARTPLFVSIIHVVLNIVLNIILSKYFGLKGLAAATAISNILSAGLLVALSWKMVGGRNYKHVFGTSLKIWLASAIMGLVSWQVFSALRAWSEAGAFLITLLVAILVYGVIILFIRIPEVQKVVNKLYHKYKRKKRK